MLRYFLRNPQAADTVEGIARWRLLNERIYTKVAETRCALRWLFERGFIIETSRLGVEPVFSLNPESTAKAEQFLATGTTARSSSGDPRCR